MQLISETIFFINYRRKPKCELNKTSPKWKTAVIGGEAAYNRDNVKILPGISPDESLSKPVHREFITDRIRKIKNITGISVRKKGLN